MMVITQMPDRKMSDSEMEVLIFLSYIFLSGYLPSSTLRRVSMPLLRISGVYIA